MMRRAAMKTERNIGTTKRESPCRVVKLRSVQTIENRNKANIRRRSIILLLLLMKWRIVQKKKREAGTLNKYSSDQLTTATCEASHGTCTTQVQSIHRIMTNTLKLILSKTNRSFSQLQGLRPSNFVQ